MFKDDLFSYRIAEIEVSYNCRIPVKDRIKITTSKDIYDLVRPIWDDSIEHRESFGILLLNRANHVLGINWISHGGISGTVTDVRLIFQIALKTNSSSIACFHNHPSTNRYPSQADDTITKKIVEAGKLIDITVLDHVIFTIDDFYSYADEGKI